MVLLVPCLLSDLLTGQSLAQSGGSQEVANVGALMSSMTDCMCANSAFLGMVNGAGEGR